MSIVDNLTLVRQQIQTLSQEHQRETGAVRLLAVSKTKPLEDIEAAYGAGQRLFGENYVQEAVEKQQALTHLQGIEWHFIGPIQSNKSRSVAESMDWVHTIDREKIARRLSEQRPLGSANLNVCIQVNISGEASKSGVALGDVFELAELIHSLPKLTLRGLMAIPAPQEDLEVQRAVYQPLKDVYDQLQAQWSEVDTLSIGMSNDMSAAIAAGSTIVRIGTAIFGHRDYP